VRCFIAGDRDALKYAPRCNAAVRVRWSAKSWAAVYNLAVATSTHMASGTIDPGVLQAIGLAIVNFSQLEEALAFGVNALIVGTRPDNAAQFALTKIGFRGLLEIFAGLFVERFGNSHEATVKALGDELQTLNDDRNHLVRSFWTPGDAGNTLARYRTAIRRKGPKVWDESMSEEDILALAVKFERAYQRLLELVVEQILAHVDAVIPALRG
jgi:hypothetical protein